MSKLSDLELTRACAEMMGLDRSPYGENRLEVVTWHGPDGEHPTYRIYDPLHDDAQCFALVKKLGILLFKPQEKWQAVPAKWWNNAPKYSYAEDYNPLAENTDLNRAICEAVAKLKERA